MKYFSFLCSIGLLAYGLSACSANNTLVSKKNAPFEEKITFSINEAVEFIFKKSDDEWKGELIIYTLNAADEKIIREKYISANDSSWMDFDSMIRFLDLYEIVPQNEIQGWIPDPSSLPKKVYRFEIHEGESERSFSYQDPIRDVRNYWQAQNILMFVTYVQDELNWVEDDR